MAPRLTRTQRCRPSIVDDNAFFIGMKRQTKRKERIVMLDLAFIRSNPDAVKEAARVKNNPIDIDYLLEVDRQVTSLQRQVDELRARQNQLSKSVQKAGKDKELRDTLIAEGKQLAEQIKALEPQLHAALEERLQ